MRADPFTLTSIFGRDVRYVVPMFQRPYVWNIKEHWEPLWEDIRGVTERVQAATEPSLGPQSLSSVPPHFLGAIVLEQVPTPTGSIDTRSVIDGQQRLATLQVFIGAARIIADKYELNLQARLLGKLLMTRTLSQSVQILRNSTQNPRSTFESRGRFTERRRTASCCRRATFSRASLRRALKAEMRARTNDEIMPA